MGGTQSHDVAAGCFDCNSTRNDARDLSAGPHALGLDAIKPPPISVTRSTRRQRLEKAHAHGVEKTHAGDLSRAIAHQRDDKLALDQTVKRMAEVENRLRIVAPKLKALEPLKHKSAATQYFELEKEHSKLLGTKNTLKQRFHELSTQMSIDRSEVEALTVLVSSEREHGCAVHRTATAVRSSASPEREARRSASPVATARRSTSPRSARRADPPANAPARKTRRSPDGRTKQLPADLDQYEVALVAPEAA